MSSFHPPSGKGLIGFSHIEHLFLISLELDTQDFLRPSRPLLTGRREFLTAFGGVLFEDIIGVTPYIFLNVTRHHSDILLAIDPGTEGQCVQFATSSAWIMMPGLTTSPDIPRAGRKVTAFCC